MQNALYDTRQNLTGIWRADDGGIYYLRQAGDEIWWAALSPTGPANAFYGRFSAQFGRFSGRWADLPRGATMEYGDLTVNVVNPSRLDKVYYTGRFPASHWFRIR